MNPAPTIDHSGPRKRTPPAAIGWLALFLIILTTKWSSITLPSAWDESWAVLPGGIWLGENSFALADLVRLPGWSEGGPASYALSPVTWLTGLVASLTTDATFLPTLHVVHFAIGAVALRQVYVFARPVWSRMGTVTLVAMTGLLPVVNAQLGGVYLELPMMATGLLTVNAALAGKWRSAAAWATLSALIKPSGIIPLAGVVAAHLVAGRIDIKKAGLILMPVLVAAASPVFFPDAVRVDSDRDISSVLTISVKTLSRSPILTLALAATIALGARIAWRNKDSEAGIRLLTSMLTIGAFGSFYLVVITTITPIYVLPRYLIQIVPFALFGAGHVLRRNYGVNIAATAATIVLIFSLLNMNGEFTIDKNRENTVSQEATNRHTELLRLTEQLLTYAETQAAVATYADRNIWYRTQLPGLGYVSEPLPDARFLPLKDFEFGDHFVILDSESSPDVSAALERLDEEDSYTQTEVLFERGPFDARYIEFVRK